MFDFLDDTDHPYRDTLAREHDLNAPAPSSAPDFQDAPSSPAPSSSATTPTFSGSPSGSSGGPFTTYMRAPSNPDDTQPSNDPPRPPDTGAPDYYQQLAAYAASKGVGMEPGYRADLARTYQGTNGSPGRTAADIYKDLHDQIDRRAASHGGASGSSSSGGGSASGGSGGSSGGSGASRAAGYSDPASALVERYALDQFGNRINPNANSGTALYEKYARELIDTLRKPVYSPQDEAVLKTQFSDAIMQERDSTKQRWLEELSARGIAPSSGVALDGLMKIESHFEGLRTTAERQFAADAIAQTRAQRFQVLDTAGALSGEEEGRLQDAGNYARVPYDLADRAFQRNLSLVGAGGSPEALTSSALGIAGFQQNSALSKAQLALQQQVYNSGNNQAMTSALLQYLGYLFG